MKIMISLILIFTFVLAALFFQIKPVIKSDTKTKLAGVENASVVNSVASRPTPTPTSTPVLFKTPGPSGNVVIPTFTAQTFNNCGPANLSMVLAFYGTNLSQQKLAEDLRPFNNPSGGVDDKEVFDTELAAYAAQLGLKSLVRPNGTAELLKKLITNGHPVIVTQWLHQNEDIGHYRIVKGYDDRSETFTVDDSYIGPNRTFTYAQFNEMWQPFNYNYLLIYPDEKSDQVAQILGPDIDDNTAQRNSMIRADEELRANPNDFYAVFNKSTASYHLGDFAASVEDYEKVAAKLPSRMLWYQLEPLYAYQQLGQDQKVINIADRILAGGNLAYADLYQLKGEIYLKQNKKDLARQMFEKALFYNKNYAKPKESLSRL